MIDLVNLPELRRRLAALDAEREPLLALIVAAEQYQAVAEASPKSQRGNAPIAPAPRKLFRPATIMAATENAVEALLMKNGPMQSGQLANELRSISSLNLDSDNRANILSARLSNSEKFETHRGLGWWFKDRPMPTKNGAAQAAPDAKGVAAPFNDDPSFEELLG